MRATATITSIKLDTVGNEIFEDLCRIYPKGDQKRWFECTLSEDDPRFQAVIDRLTHAGFQPWSDHFRKRQSNEYCLRLDREYTAEDLQDVLYFEPRPISYCEGLTRDLDGRIEINVDRLERDAGIAVAFSTLLVVSTQNKTELEHERMQHLGFRPTVLIDEFEGSIPWSDYGDEYWELTSDLSLPPLSTSCKLLHEDGQVFTGDFPRGCYVEKGLFLHGEIRYNASDLATVGEFDFARTREQFGGRNRGYKDIDASKGLVASRRFYDFCNARGLGVEWIPVYVEEG